MAKKILFVDDAPKVLEGLCRMLRPQRQEWNMVFVSSGAEALAALTDGKFDVLVTDMRMPGMDGAELLAHVRVLYPHMVRIILTGQCSRDSLSARGPVGPQAPQQTLRCRALKSDPDPGLRPAAALDQQHARDPGLTYRFGA